MKTIPNALDMAHKLVKDNPELFKSDMLTISTIAHALLVYGKAFSDWYMDKESESLSDSLSNQFMNIVKKDAKDRLNIDL